MNKLDLTKTEEKGILIKLNVSMLIGLIISIITITVFIVNSYNNIQEKLDASVKKNGSLTKVVI